jgi:hypothetical protein
MKMPSENWSKKFDDDEGECMAGDLDGIVKLPEQVRIYETDKGTFFTDRNNSILAVQGFKGLLRMGDYFITRVPEPYSITNHEAIRTWDILEPGITALFTGKSQDEVPIDERVRITDVKSVSEETYKTLV